MKKMIKWMLILSAVFCVLGVGIIAAGAMMGGGHYMRQALRIADRWDGYYRDREEEDSDHGAVTADKAVPAVPGSEEIPLEGSFSYENIRELEAEIDGTVFLMESEELSQGQVMIAKGEDGEDYEYVQDGGTLKIHWPPRSRKNRNSFGKTITILVPAGGLLDEIDIQVAAGIFQADAMGAREISLEAKAGVIEVKQAEADILEMEVDAGKIFCRADVKREVRADTDLGEILLELQGKKEDFNYELECSAGSIVLGDKEPREYQGLHYETTLDHGAQKRAKLECSAGSITVTYRQDPGLEV